MRNLHIGCLETGLPGWVNTDITPHIFIARVPGAARLLRGLSLMTRERYEQHRRGVFARVRYLNAAKHFPYSTGSFDNVFSCHMLEHLYRSEARNCVSEVYRVLKPGGVFRVIVPDLDIAVRDYDRTDPESFLEKIYVNTQRQDKNRHHWMYTAASLAELLLRSGFGKTQRCSYRIGQCPDLDKLDSRPDESLFMEGVK